MTIIHILTGTEIGGIENLVQNYTRLSIHRNIVVSIWKSGPIANKIESNGIKVITIDKSHTDIYGILRSILAICKSEKASIVIAHHAAPVSHICLLYLKYKLPKIKTIAYAHQNAIDMCHVEDKKKYKLRKFILSRSFSKANLVIAISESVKRSLKEYLKISLDNVEVLPNGVDIDKFSRKSMKVIHCPMRIIFVGRLIQEKGVQNTIRALALLADNLNFKFIIAGDGPYRSELQKLAIECGISDRVIFVGAVEDVSGYLFESDVFIHMPEWEEGFGIAVIEAMAAGLICICSNSGAIPEIIGDKVNGYIIDNKNKYELAKKISEICSSEQSTISSISYLAQERAKMFSIDRYVYKFDRIVEEL